MRQRRDGRWDIDVRHGRGERFRFIFPEDPNTKATLAEAKEAELEFRRGMGLDVEVGRKTKLRHFVTEYLEDCKIHDAERTYQKKKKLLYGYLLPFFGEISPKLISSSPSRVNRYTKARLSQIKSKSAVQGGKEAINQEIMVLSKFLKYIGYPPREPFTRFKLIERTLEPPSKEEVTAIIDAMEPFWKAFYYTMYYTGIRSDEVKRLRIKDVHRDKRYLFIFGKGSKERLVPINNKLLEILKEHIDENAADEALVFPSPAKGFEGKKLVSINKAIFRAKERAGITRRITPHMFRHAFGTHMVQAGANLKRL